MSSLTLILTPWMTPHKIVSWETAVCLICNGKVDVLEEYDVVIYSKPEQKFEMRMPCVARLKKAISAIKKGVKFSRVNVMTRDHFCCQYCGTKKPMSQLNYDHVIPRSQGGKTVWENVVTSCYPCNDRKAGRTPEQAGMKLLKLPVRPKTLPLASPSIVRVGAPEIWSQYVDVQLAAWG